MFLGVHAIAKPSDKTPVQAQFFSHANNAQTFFSPVIQRAPATETEAPIDLSKFGKAASLTDIRQRLDACEAAKLGKAGTITTQSTINEHTA